MSKSKKILSRIAVGAALVLAAPFALAQTASTSTSTATTTPGTPNTGAGGDSTQSMLVLGVSAAAILGAAAYLASRRTLRS